MCDLCRSDRGFHPLASGQLDLDLRSQTDRRLPHRLRSRPLLLSTSPAQSPHRTNRSRPPPRSRIRSLISPLPPKHHPSTCPKSAIVLRPLAISHHICLSPLCRQTTHFGYPRWDCCFSEGVDGMSELFFNKRTRIGG